MIFTPHTIEKKIVAPVQRDEFGRPLQVAHAEEWSEICRCRCDDETDREIMTPNGKIFYPKYHIVCEKEVDINPGDVVRCKEGENVRSEGEVKISKRNNFFGYYELWI